jgi:hypothetical protein
MPLFFTFIFLSDDTLQDITSHNLPYIYDEAGVYEWSCNSAVVVSHGSNHIVVMRLGQVRFFSMESVVLRLQSVAEFFGLSPQLGLEPCPTHQML